MKTEPLESLTRSERNQRQTLSRWLGAPGAKQKRLLDELLTSMVLDYTEHGPEAIEAVRKTDPLNYLRLMLLLVRKPLEALETERLFGHDDVVEALARLDQIAKRYSLDFDGLAGGRDDPLPGADLQPLSEAE